MRQLILGTDWWTDCDDAVAVRMIARYAKANKIKWLGAAINACMEDSVASLVGFLKSEGIENLPVGLDAGAENFGGVLTYQMRLAQKLCPEGKNEDAMDAVRLYRQLLAHADEPVEIMEIGFLQAVVALFESGPDDISEKTGMELVKEKVTKFWVMAGKWDADGEMEHNFCLNARTRVAAEAFCRLCPVDVTFLGWEVGIDVLSGGKLSPDDELALVLADHGSAKGRHSWDPMLALMALIGDEGEAGYDTVTGWARVDAQTGRNYFAEDAKGRHRYVVKKFENAYYEDAINEIIA